MRTECRARSTARSSYFPTGQAALDIEADAVGGPWVVPLQISAGRAERLVGYVKIKMSSTGVYRRDDSAGHSLQILQGPREAR